MTTQKMRNNLRVIFGEFAGLRAIVIVMMVTATLNVKRIACVHMSAQGDPRTTWKELLEDPQTRNSNSSLIGTREEGLLDLTKLEAIYGLSGITTLLESCKLWKARDGGKKQRDSRMQILEFYFAWHASSA